MLGPTLARQPAGSKVVSRQSGRIWQSILRQAEQDGASRWGQVKPARLTRCSLVCHAWVLAAAAVPADVAYCQQSVLLKSASWWTDALWGAAGKLQSPSWPNMRLWWWLLLCRFEPGRAWRGMAGPKDSGHGRPGGRRGCQAPSSSNSATCNSVPSAAQSYQSWP
jgi:hypothetical protein